MSSETSQNFNVGSEFTVHVIFFRKVCETE